MGASEGPAAGQLIDTARYPLAEPARVLERSGIAHPARPGGRRLQFAGQLHPPSARDALRRECARIAPLAYCDVEIVNVYNVAADSALPADHPGRIAMERGNAFVARDQIPADFLIHQLYTSKPFQHFIASCFGLPALYELADPLAAFA